MKVLRYKLVSAGYSLDTARSALNRLTHLTNEESISPRTKVKLDQIH